MATKQTQSTRSELAKKAAPAGATQAGPAGITTLDGAGTNQAKGASAAVSDAPGAELRRPTKAGLLQQMLACPEGTSLAALMRATGWQAHTVRAALTRLRQAGHAVERSRSEAGATVYRIVPAEAAAAETPAVKAAEDQPDEAERLAPDQPVASAEAPAS